MDKLGPTFQDTPVTAQVMDSPSTWYKSEVTAGKFTPSEVAWMHAQGWTTLSAVTSGGSTTYFMSRRLIEPESVLQSLVSDYTAAYNEGRNLNDQRYDDLLVLYTSVLDKTETSFNLLETDDDTYEDLVEVLVSSLSSDYATWAADVDGDLDDWGTNLTEEVNARFDVQLSEAMQRLMDRGMYSSAMWPTQSAGIERERTRALNSTGDTIEQRQLELKNKIFDEQKSMRARVLAARDRLRVYLSSAKDRQISVRNSVAEALGRLVERRTDSYPSLAEVGKLAAMLGAGSSEAFSP